MIRRMDLEELSWIAQILGGVAVVVALVFGMVQIRQFRQQRLDGAAIELMRSLQDHEFTHSFRLLYPLPEGIPADEFRALGVDHEEAALAIGTCFETIGLLVYRDSLPLPIVEELIGGAVVLLWKRLKPWVEANRAEKNHPLLFEWFQWLAERLEDRGRPTQTPAYARYAQWTPKRTR
jgi:hypothetical protein